MSNFSLDDFGKMRELQNPDPVRKPSGAEPDCAFCRNKRRCVMHARRQFFIGEHYAPCQNYDDLAAWEDAENERIKRLRESEKIKDPTPRPPEEAQDCLYCVHLYTGMRSKYAGTRCKPMQGQQRVCDLYSEVRIRSENEPRHCTLCLIHSQCSRSQVFRNGQPCKKYLEYTPEPVKQTEVSNA
jgi:hypothetical protein